MSRAIFLDRDGTLNEEKHYLHKVEDVVLFPEAGAALRRLQEAGYKLFIITNQAGVGRGYFTMVEVEAVNARVMECFAAHGVHFEKIYVAPEAPSQPSRGRKPSPQFLFDARDEFGVNLSESYMIGDKWIDLECGWNAGVKKSILVKTGYGAKTVEELNGEMGKALVLENLAAVADWILKAS